MEEQQKTEQPTQVVTMGPEGKKPFSKRTLVIVLAVITLVAAVGIVATILVANNKETTEQPTTSTQKAAVVVAITDTGFVPATLTVTKGTTVVWKNDSQSPRQVGANPFPDHSSLPGLYSKEVIAPGGTYEYTFNEAGEWGYADYTKPTLSATVIVK